MHPYLMFYVSFPDEATARTLSRTLLEERIVACANIFPIGSMYHWEGAIEQADEWVSVFKTALTMEKAVENRLRQLHPYEVPCLMRTEVRANREYVEWVELSVAPV